MKQNKGLTSKAYLKGSMPLLAILLFLLFSCICAMLIYSEYTDYQDKMNIIYQTAGSDGSVSEADNIANLGAILRGRTDEARDGRQVLEKYGYDKDYQNIFLKTFWQKSLMTAGLTFGGYLLSLFLVGSILERKNRYFRMKMEEVGKILEAFRDGQYKITDKYDITDKYGMLPLYDKLESIGKYLEVTTEKARSEEAKTKAIVTDISHQIKTPLAALTTSIGILKDKDLSAEDYENFVHMSEEQVCRLNELLSSMLQISRLEGGLIVLDLKEQSIFDTILMAVNRIYPEAALKRMEIELDEAYAEHLMIKHDRKWLSEALINILDNDVKYGKEDTTITIRVLCRHPFLKIEIEDQGYGIKREERVKIFKRFYRGAEAVKQQQSGSGVGLYLTKKIVDMHGGTIRVSSPKGKRAGSVFVLLIPIV